MTAAIYARKSTQQNGADDDAKSVARQIENARAFAAAKGWTVPDEFIFSDDAVSGAETKRLVNRQRLLDAIRNKPPFQAIIMRDSSRFSRRDGDEAFAELKAIVKAGVAVHFYQDGTSFAFGTLGDNIIGFVKAEMNAEFRRQIARWTREAMQRKALAGHCTGGTVFGFTNERVNGHVERVVNQAEADVVRRIFRLCRDGNGMLRIAKLLNRENVPAPGARLGRPGDGWVAVTVRSILHRDLYRGISTWGRQRKRDKTGECRPSTRPESEWTRVEMPNLRIVSDDLWDAAHERLRASRQNYLRWTDGRLFGKPANLVTSRHLLVGLARCDECGTAMAVYSRSYKRHRTFNYACPRSRADLCRNTLEVPMTMADEAALSMFTDDVLSPATVALTLTKLDAMLNGPTEDGPERRARLRATVKRTEKEIGNLTATIAAGGPESLVVALRAREREHKAATEELKAFAAGPVLRESAPEIRREALRLLDDWRALLTRNTATSRQMLAKLLNGGRFTFKPQGKGDARYYELRAQPSLAKFIGSLSALKKTGYSPSAS
jgi:site-specific DNA recombinase